MAPAVRRRGVALHNHGVRFLLGEEFVQSVNGPGHDGRERLPLLQDIEVVVRHNAEEFVDLVQHLAVLAGDGHDTVKELRLVQRGNDREPS